MYKMLRRFRFFSDKIVTFAADKTLYINTVTNGIL